MRNYANCIEAVKEIERDLAEMGTLVHAGGYQDIVSEDEDYATLELVAYNYTILNIGDRDQMLKYLDLPKEYAIIEFADRMRAGLNPGSSWKLRKDVWDQFRDENGRFAYTYSERLHEKDQLDDTINLLKAFPGTRQGVITIYNNWQDVPARGGLERVPCSMYYHFFIRDSKLVLIYNMRSCDFKTHFGYDVWLATELQQHVARQVHYQTGPFIHQIGSLHMFRKDAEGVF